MTFGRRSTIPREHPSPARRRPQDTDLRIMLDLQRMHDAKEQLITPS